MTRVACALPLMAALVSGCSQPDRETFLNVKPGMNPREVHELLGTPRHSEIGTVGAYTGLTEQWFGENEHYTVQYLNNEVKLTTITPAARSAEK